MPMLRIRLSIQTSPDRIEQDGRVKLGGNSIDVLQRTDRVDDYRSAIVVVAKNDRDCFLPIPLEK